MFVSGGNACDLALQDMTDWRGHDVMYFGDSLWADLVEARRLYGWYTGAIIRELDDELRIVRGERYGRLAFTETVVGELLRCVQAPSLPAPIQHMSTHLHLCVRTPHTHTYICIYVCIHICIDAELMIGRSSHRRRAGYLVPSLTVLCAYLFLVPSLNVLCAYLFLYNNNKHNSK